MIRLPRSLCVVALLVTCGALLVSTAEAQQRNRARNASEDEARQQEIRRLVAEGMTEALETKLRGDNSPDALRAIAEAYVNRAVQQRDDAKRQAAFEIAEQRYRAWINKLELMDGDPRQVGLEVARARTQLGGMIVGRWASADLDQYEFTAGRSYNRDRLTGLLRRACKEFDQAADAVEPLFELIEGGERDAQEEMLALGLFESVQRLKLDIDFSGGWANLYLGMISPEGSRERTSRLGNAQKMFQYLADSERAGSMAAQVYLGLGLTLREQSRSDDAIRYLEEVVKAENPVLAAQGRYELARTQMAANRFEEARLTLRPLAEKDPERLPLAERATRFYVNLAKLWDANSYLVESASLRSAALDSAAVKRKAERLAEQGLVAMYRLADNGGAWGDVVQLFVSDYIKPQTDPAKLSALELLFTARHLMRREDFKAARDRLEVAAKKQDLSDPLKAQVLYELGACQYRATELITAASTFETLAFTLPQTEQASKAAEFAFQLWAQVAEQTREPRYYLRLANCLDKLIETFPQHPRRLEALWSEPVALQAAGDYERAIPAFARVPKESGYWEEARFRRLVCLRLALENKRGALAPAEFADQARRAATQLLQYADEADGRATRSVDPLRVRGFAAAARVNAAELLVSEGVGDYQRALDVLEPFERQQPGSPLLPRVLATRIAALRGLGKIDDAAKVVARFIEKVPPEKSGGVLLILAQGMQEEVEQRLERGDTEAARKLARQSLDTFAELERWVKADVRRAEFADAVLFGQAQMRYLAGELEPARAAVADLLTREPESGAYHWLEAQILSAQVEALASDADAGKGADLLRTAQSAWSRLLRDPKLFEQAPRRYWQARYEYLKLALREGKQEEVGKAIRQERIWHPELGGEPWKSRLEDLERAAERSPEPTSQPA